jgi:anti-sigma B factor antagonist
MLSRAIISAATHATVVIVDLSGVTFCDCAGLGRLVGMYRQMGEGNVEMRVVSSSPRVQKTMAISKYDQMLPVFDNLADAVAAAPRSWAPHHQAA